MKNLLRSLPILTFFLIASGASQVAQVVKSLPPNCRRQRHGFDPWVREAPLENEMATLSSNPLQPGKTHGPRSWVRFIRSMWSEGVGPSRQARMLTASNPGTWLQRSGPGATLHPPGQLRLSSPWSPQQGAWGGAGSEQGVGPGGVPVCQWVGRGDRQLCGLFQLRKVRRRPEGESFSLCLISLGK